jgi:hypothetical protein
MALGVGLATSGCTVDADIAKTSLDGGDDSSNGGQGSDSGAKMNPGNCGGSSCDAGAPDAIADGGTPDVAGDTAAPNPPTDGSAPADASVLLTCPETIDAYCAMDSGPLTPCRRTFGSVQATLPAPCNPQVMPATQETDTCGGYETWSVYNVDSSYTGYYDAQTGQLVAIVYYAAPTPGSSCVAGPPTFAEPASCSNGTWYCN